MQVDDDLFIELEDKMDKAVANAAHELNSLRTGRASAATVEEVPVTAYGTEQKLKQVASINIPDASTILIQPWDPNLLATIEKALLSANIGMTPNNDGKVIRLNVPPLTEETRKDMVRRSHELAEEGRIAVRNLRRHANDEIKKSEKAHDLSEDEAKRLLDKVQERTDAHIKRIDELMEHKEKEIMTV